MKVRAVILFIATCALAGCGDGADQPANDAIVIQDNEAPAEPAQLSEQDLIRVCKAGNEFRNGKGSRNLKAKVTSEQEVRLSYTRQADGKAFQYDCAVAGNVLRFRMIDEAGPGTGPGTWSGRGSVTLFKLNPESVEIHENYMDGSSDSKTILI